MNDKHKKQHDTYIDISVVDTPLPENNNLLRFTATTFIEVV